MKQILPVTYSVMDDEPCYWLTEQHLQSPGSKGFRRYQIAWVMRGDKLHEFTTDLGPASKFKGVEQFNVQGGGTDVDTGRIWIEHTVAELREIADVHRNGLMGKAPTYEPIDYRALLTDQMDRKRRERKRQSTFGPYSRVERN